MQSAEFGIAPTAGTPILAGILVDVSGSMVVATMGGEGLGDNGQTRIQAVSRALDELVAKGAEYSRQGAGQSAGSLLKVFMYGFGFGGVLSSILSSFLGRASGSNDAVRDLLALPGRPSSTVGINELAEDWAAYRANVERMLPDMLGETPMASALRTAQQRFQTERSSARYSAEPILLLISDGEPTPEDWTSKPHETVRAIAMELKGQGVIIVSCLLTGEDLGEPRRIYGVPEANWPEGAKLLFDCASEIPPNSPFRQLLREYRWKIDQNGRLFTQVNRSDILEEFSQLLLTRLPGATSRTAPTQASMNDSEVDERLEARKSDRPTKVFVSYSHQDEKYLGGGELLDYLSGLHNEGIELWWDGRIETGDLWDQTIRDALNSSDIAIALVSQAFLNSKYCQDVEVRTFLEQRKARGMKILPLILSPCDWRSYPWLSSTQALPRDGTIGTHYGNRAKRQQLYLDLLNDIRRLSQELKVRRANK